MVQDKINFLIKNYSFYVEYPNEFYEYICKIYDRYSLWDKKVLIVSNTTELSVPYMDKMIGKIYSDFCFYIPTTEDLPKNIDIIDINYINIEGWTFHLKDIEFTKG